MTRQADTSTLERAVRLLSEYANSGVPDAVSLENALRCVGSSATPSPSPSAGEVLLEAEALIQRLEVALKAIAKSGDGEFMQGHAEHHLNTTCHRAKKVRRQLLALATAPQPTPEREALELAAETLEESGGRDIDTRCHDQAAQGSEKLSVARYLRSLAGDPEPTP